jgi:hypothetical protein
MVYDLDLFLNTIANVFNGPKFKTLTPSNVQTLLKSFTFLTKNDNSLKLLISDIVNIQKGVGLDCFIQLEMKLALFEKQKK